ncbi:hypothetical protein DPMN_100655 [Dreissena polymorpha]|uniref:G-protein coupled receptors family 1 profile domain-containing protein n=1 Tax=Dreissena polymorpha TaxID=45954 RepID=A0A9D4LHF9_DREPO|nr:hypothetical protein DPMN_100655 [Dreissena polymorpha]
MDQHSELKNYRHYFREHSNESSFNYTLADDIIQEFEANLFTLNKFSTIVLLSMYTPIFIIGLVGNILIIASVTADKARKSNLYFLVNLALSDLVVTVFCMPTCIGTIVYKPWVYGRVLCKFTAFVQGVAVAVSIFSMTAMSVDRYFSLQYPIRAHRESSSGQACSVIIAMWVVAGLFMGPLLYIRDVDILQDVPFLRPMSFCIEKWPHVRDRQAYGVFLMFVVFIIPAFTIGICYGSIGRALCVIERHERVSSDGSTQRLMSRKRAARMVIILICAFMFCWFPYSVLSILADISDNGTLVSVLPFVLWLGQAHSAFNPMLYWSLNRRFRTSLHRLVSVVRITGCSSTSANNVTIPHYV